MRLIVCQVGSHLVCLILEQVLDLDTPNSAPVPTGLGQFSLAPRVR
mgnify:CR=1 FL=1